MRTPRPTVKKFPRTALAAIIIVSAVCLLPSDAQAQNLTPTRFLLAERLLDGAPNMLGPTSMVLDAWKGMVYVHARDFSPVAAFEMYSGRRRAHWLAVPDSLNRTFRLSHVHPRSGLIFGEARPGAEAILLVLDPLNPNAKWRPLLGTSEVGGFRGMVSDPDEDRLYVSTGRNHVLVLDGATLQLVDSLNAGFQTGGIAVDSIHQRLYIAQARPDAGITRVSIFSTTTLERVRVNEYDSEIPMDRVIVDPGTQRYAMLGDGRITLFDEFGRRIREVVVQGGTGAAAGVPQLNALFYFSRAPFIDQGVHGRFGKLYRCSFTQNDVDSTLLGLDAQGLCYYAALREFASMNHSSSTIDVLYAADLSHRRSMSLGHSIEDAALSADGRTLFVTNALGSGSSVTLCERYSNGMSVMPAGPWPVRLLRNPVTGEMAVANHFQNTLRFVDSTLFTTSDTLMFSNLFENRSDALPGTAASWDGKAVITYPEQERFALVDLNAHSVLRTERIPGFAFGGETGAGALQAAFYFEGTYFAILSPRMRMMWVYTVNSPGLWRSIDLSGLDWNRIAPFERNALAAAPWWMGMAVGPYRIDIRNGLIDSIALPGAVQILGMDSRYWALDHSGPRLELIQSGSPTFINPQRYSLEGSRKGADLIRVDSPLRHILLLGYSREAEVLLYDYSLVVGADALSHPPEAALELFPNPFRRSGGGDVCIRLRGTVPSDDMHRAIVSDMLGREAMRCEFNGDMRFIDIRSLSPGMYMLRVEKKTMQFSQPLLITP